MWSSIRWCSASAWARASDRLALRIAPPIPLAEGMTGEPHSRRAAPLLVGQPGTRAGGGVRLRDRDARSRERHARAKRRNNLDAHGCSTPRPANSSMASIDRMSAWRRSGPIAGSPPPKLRWPDCTRSRTQCRPSARLHHCAPHKAPATSDLLQNQDATIGAKPPRELWNRRQSET